MWLRVFIPDLIMKRGSVSLSLDLLLLLFFLAITCLFKRNDRSDTFRLDLWLHNPSDPVPFFSFHVAQIERVICVSRKRA